MSERPPLPGTTPPPGWSGILLPDERILWQGQPDSRIRLNPVERINAMLGVIAIGFLFFWLWTLPGSRLIGLAAGLFIVGIGLRRVLGPALLSAFRLSRSFYTLTDRGAIIATDLPFQGRRLSRFPIDANTGIDYSWTEPPSILIGPQVGGRRGRPGFMYIPEADRVIEMMRQIQRAQQPPTDQIAPEDRQP